MVTNDNKNYQCETLRSKITEFNIEHDIKIKGSTPYKHQTTK